MGQTAALRSLTPVSCLIFPLFESGLVDPPAHGDTPAESSGRQMPSLVGFDRMIPDPARRPTCREFADLHGFFGAGLLGMFSVFE
jgi:hypothetical protein